MTHESRRSCALRMWIGAGVLLAVVATASAAPVGTAFTYQGRLEDGQVPANGTYDLEFRFYDAENGGSQVGSTVAASAVAVAEGWVAVELDFGAVFDGTARWLEVSVRPTGGGSYVTLTPRREMTPTPHAAWAEDAAHAATADDAAQADTADQAAHALNADEATHATTADSATTAQQLGGLPAGAFIDISTSLQIKQGRLVLGAASGSGLDYGIEAYGFNGGGRFADHGGSALVLLGQAATGVLAEGDMRGGYFLTTSGTGDVSLAMGDRGVEAYGSDSAGYFAETDGTGIAEVAVHDYGIRAFGDLAGGYFEQSDGSGRALLAHADHGIYGFASTAGGVFEDVDDSGSAYVGYGDRGIEAEGSEVGGFFSDSDGSGYAHVGRGSHGIMAYGSIGGYFHGGGGSGVATVGYTDTGITASGDVVGGSFFDFDDSGFAFAGWGDIGLRGVGDGAGGYFQDSATTSVAFVGYDTYKIQGNGTVSFVQNHPHDQSKVVVYHAPEASEVAVYSRGSGRLEGGRAVIALDPTFALVANPDLGLTAHLTARGELVELATGSVSSGELVVIGPPGSDAVFDYMVWGLRIGFEELAPVQLKEREAFIPSMHDHRELYAAEPSLRGFNAFERFATRERELKGLEKSAPLDLGRAEALKTAIHEFDPAVDTIPDLEERPERPEWDESAAARDASTSERRAIEQTLSNNRNDRSADTAARQSLETASLLDADGNLDAHSLSTEGAGLAVELPAYSGVVPGDVVAVDPDTGLLAPAAESGDLRVVGIAADDPGVVLGSGATSDPIRARVVLSGVAVCRVDAGFGDILPGDLLIASPTPGHAMRAGGDPLPGSVVAKALEPLAVGQGAIRVLVWLR